MSQEAVRIGLSSQTNIADVQNIQITNVLYGRAYSSDPQNLARLKLIDRYVQCETLQEALKQHIHSQSRHPLIVVIHGVARDLMHSFMDRMATHDIPRIFRIPCQNLGLLPWPERHLESTARSLLSALSSTNVDYLQDGDEFAHLSSAIETQAGALCFGHILDSSDGIKRRGRMIDDWLTAIYEKSRCKLKTNLLIPFLFVTLRDPETAHCKWILKKFKSISKERKIIFLERCGLISNTHVAEWVDLVNRLDRKTGSKNNLPLDISDRIFANEERSLRYGVVYERLRRIIDETYRKHEQEVIYDHRG